MSKLQFLSVVRADAEMPRVLAWSHEDKTAYTVKIPASQAKSLGAGDFFTTNSQLDEATDRQKNTAISRLLELDQKSPALDVMLKEKEVIAEAFAEAGADELASAAQVEKEELKNSGGLPKPKGFPTMEEAAAYTAETGNPAFVEVSVDNIMEDIPEAEFYYDENGDAFPAWSDAWLKAKLDVEELDTETVDLLIDTYMDAGSFNPDYTAVRADFQEALYTGLSEENALRKVQEKWSIFNDAELEEICLKG